MCHHGIKPPQEHNAAAVLGESLETGVPWASWPLAPALVSSRLQGGEDTSFSRVQED